MFFVPLTSACAAGCVCVYLLCAARRHFYDFFACVAKMDAAAHRVATLHRHLAGSASASASSSSSVSSSGSASGAQSLASDPQWRDARLWLVCALALPAGDVHGTLVPAVRRLSGSARVVFAGHARTVVGKAAFESVIIVETGAGVDDTGPVLQLLGAGAMV